MSIIIDFREARERLRPPPVQSSPRTIYDLTLDERLFDAEHLPFVSGLPTSLLEGRWP